MLAGYISARYESRGKPSEIPSDTGEQSYGTFQLLGDPLKTNDDPMVIKFLKKSGYYKGNFADLALNTPAFKAEWKRLGESDPLFGAAQYRFMAETHFYPLAKYVEKKGIARTSAIDEALFSIGVEHGRARKICDDAIAQLDPQKSSETEIINALYDARINYVKGLIEKKIGREEDLKNILEKRYPEERQAVLGLVKNKNVSPQSAEDFFQQLGLSPDEAKKAVQEVSRQSEFKPAELSKKLNAMLEWYKKNQIPESESDDDDDDDDNDDDEDDNEEKSSVSAITPPAPLTPPIDLEIAEKKRQEELKGVSDFLDFMGAFGDKIQNKAFVQTVGVIKHTIEAYEAINKLRNLTGSILSGSALGAIGALGGAVLGIINLFIGSGPDATEIIFDQLNRLAEQIAELKNYMLEQFKDIREEQVKMINAIYSGFNALSLQINNQIGSLRYDVDERLDKISAAVIYLATKISLDIKELAFQGLRKDYTSVKTLIESNNAAIDGDPSVVIPALSQDLFNWVVAESASALYTGRTVYRSLHLPDVLALPGAPTDAAILRDVLYAEERDSSISMDVLVASTIGFLASYYTQYGDKKLTADIDVEKIPNPQIWHDVAQKLLALKQSFIKYDKDSGDYQTKEILKSGSAFNALINAIAQDNSFWQLMCDRYNKLTSSLALYQSRYMEQYSNTVKQALKTKDEKSIYNLDPVMEWNFLAKPEKLIGLMGLRNIREVTSFSNQLGLTKTNPIFKAINVRHDLFPATLVAAEYLELASFTAEQNGYVPLPFCINPIVGADFDEVDAKLNQRGGKRQQGDTVIGKAGGEIFRKAEGSSERVTEWTLPVCLSINTALGKYNAVQFNFNGSYDQLAVETAFWKQNVVVGFRPIPGRNLFVWRPKYSMPGGGKGSYGYDLQHAIPDYIKNFWEQTEQVKAAGQSLVTSQEVANIKGLIDSYFIYHRKQIATILNLNTENSQGTDKERQKYHTLYRNILVELDIHVRLMQLFSYLIGKDIKQSFFKNLSTSQTVSNELALYQRDATLSTRFVHQATQISESEILAQPDLNTMQASRHPKQLFEKVSVAIEVYRNAKILPQLSPDYKVTVLTAALTTSIGLEPQDHKVEPISDFPDEHTNKLTAEKQHIDTFLKDREAVLTRKKQESLACFMPADEKLAFPLEEDYKDIPSASHYDASLHNTLFFSNSSTSLESKDVAKKRNSLDAKGVSFSNTNFFKEADRFNSASRKRQDDQVTNKI